VVLDSGVNGVAETASSGNGAAAAAKRALPLALLMLLAAFLPWLLLTLKKK
jgi:hypothetical protein